MSRFYPCVYCTEEGYCKKYSDDEVTSWCVQSPCKDEKSSNADRIRAMTDEELATFLYHAWNNASWCSAKDCPDEDSCLPCWLDWLRQEAE